MGQLDTHTTSLNVGQQTFAIARRLCYMFNVYDCEIFHTFCVLIHSLVASRTFSLYIAVASPMCTSLHSNVCLAFKRFFAEHCEYLGMS